MTIEELYARFPEVPRDLRGEPVLAEFAAVFGDYLASAFKPGNCSTGYAPGNHYYLKLMGPISYYGYGLASRERVLQDLRGLLEEHAADPEGFARALVPADVAGAEIKGPGCT